MVLNCINYEDKVLIRYLHLYCQVLLYKCVEATAAASLALSKGRHPTKGG